MDSLAKALGTLLGGCFALIIFEICWCLVVPFIFMLLWNYVMPSLVNLPEINYWYSFAIIIMCRICTFRPVVKSN